MASSNQILAQIQYAENMGLVDEQLHYAYGLKKYNDDEQYFINLIQQFLVDTLVRFRKIEYLLNGNVVDFDDLDVDAVTIFGSAASVGASQVKKACINLRVATGNRSKVGCLQAFNDVKREYAVVRPHFDAILQLERDFIRNGNK